MNAYFYYNEKKFSFIFPNGQKDTFKIKKVILHERINL